MPEDPADLPRWMDEKLLAPTLPGLIEELRILYRPGRVPKLDRVLGKEKKAFLEGGFSAISRATFAQCMRNPDLLRELQSLVFVEGGDRWFSESSTREAETSATRVSERVLDKIWQESVKPKPRRWGYAVLSLASAAAILVSLYIGGAFSTNSHTGDNPGWGFARLQQLPRNADPKQVYQQLAKMADEFNSRTPTDSTALARRLTEFRQGCAMLQLASDLPLSEPDRRWLKYRCADWSAAFDRHLHELEETGDVGRVRTAASATARNIAQELRDRSA